MPQGLDGKVALITGACSGIGLGTVSLFVAEGARVVVADMQDAKGAFLEQCFPGQIRYIHCDVTVEADVKAAAALAASAFGGLDILVNNAGNGGARGGIEQIETKAWDDTFALLVRAPVIGMKHAVPLMKQRGGGAIVNIASIAGQQAGMAGLAYSACKAAVIHLTKVASAELSPQNIRVNAICPGLIATSIIGDSLGLPREAADQMASKIAQVAHKFQPVPKPGLPHDIAQAALFLSTDASAFISGTHLVVDGGLSIGPPTAWSPTAGSPLLDALGITPEKAKGIRKAPIIDEHVE
ncbi:SDR family NAD(P)-dependent oxidoreductase [Bradyrhizobium sp. USDA 4502]